MIVEEWNKSTVKDTFCIIYVLGFHQIVLIPLSNNRSKLMSLFVVEKDIFCCVTGIAKTPSYIKAKWYAVDV